MAVSENAVAETSFTKQQFYSYLQKKARDPYRPRVTLLGVFSDGTRYMVEDQTYARDFFLVTDLSAPERRVGSASVIISASTLRGALSVTLSPALKDSVLSNYKVFSSVNDPSVSIVWSSQARLVSQSSLSVAAIRMPTSSGVTGSSPTGVTITAGDLTDVTIVSFTDPHGADAGFKPHGHTTTGHTPVDPQHSHGGGVPGTASGALTVNVDYLIWHV